MNNAVNIEEEEDLKYYASNSAFEGIKNAVPISLLMWIVIGAILMKFC